MEKLQFPIWYANKGIYYKIEPDLDKLREKIAIIEEQLDISIPIFFDPKDNNTVMITEESAPTFFKTQEKTLEHFKQLPGYGKEKDSGKRWDLMDSIYKKILASLKGMYEKTSS